MIKRLKATCLLFMVSLLLAGAIGLLIGSPSRAGEAEPLQKVVLKIEGITCGSCISKIKSALSKTPGVVAVEMKIKKKWVIFSDYSDARAVVAFEPSRGDVNELIKAVEGAGDALSGYKATLIE